MTEAEKKLWYQFLSPFQPKVHRQRPLGDYIVDFYIPKAKIVIEIDGDSHFESTLSQEKDRVRDMFLNSRGLKVIRFTNNDIHMSFESVCEEIENQIRRNTP